MSDLQFTIDCVRQIYAQETEIIDLKKRLRGISEAARKLLREIHGFNDGCDCCALRNAEDVPEYHDLSELVEEPD